MSAGKLVILVVEDNPDNITLAQKVLAHYGYDVVVQTNGESALTWAAASGADLVLMDVSLPGKDGLQVTRELRQLPRYQTTPIIALTAHAMKGFGEQCALAGCSGYLPKPFLPKELVEVIRRFLPA